MKKQINPTIKAHLIRGASYLLLLVAVCAIPFALAQRNTFKQVNRATQSKMATKFAGARPASGVAQATKLSGVHSKARREVALLLAVISKPVTYHLGSTPEIPRLPVSTPASSTQEPSHYSPVRSTATVLLIRSSRPWRVQHMT